MFGEYKEYDFGFISVLINQYVISILFGAFLITIDKHAQTIEVGYDPD